MSEPGRERQVDPLVKETRKRGERHRRWRESGDDGVARRLAQVGVLGWMIVTPALVGLFVGRALDRRFGGGLTWSAGLLVAGVALGCWSAWRWMHET